jgi:prepilin-type N-terminal cleavage/methylation domain-containing protein/prepilin-type processing-associated H-X9-DG protein
MKNSKAFTLMELLVVISIIALLLAILVPSLGKARELARQAVCRSNIKNLCIANNTYASSFNGSLCPVAYKRDSSTVIRWMENKAFRKYLQLDELGSGGVFKLPKKLRCPSDKITTASSLGVLTSYGYNLTDWDKQEFGPIFDQYVGHKIEAVKQPADKLAFVDGIDWWVAWRYADYRKGWDILGQASIDEYEAIGIHGPTIYRHGEAAIVGFYDGHEEREKKQDIYVIDEFPDNPGMWTASGTYNGPISPP